MSSVKDVFNWKRATDTADEKWEPPIEYNIKGNKFKVVCIDGNIKNPRVGKIVTLAEDPDSHYNNPSDRYLRYFIYENAHEEILYWYEVSPYYE